MLPEPGEVERDEVQRKIAFGPGWFKRKNAKEQLKAFESWQSCRSGDGSSSLEMGDRGQGDGKEGSPGRDNGAAGESRSRSQWNGSIRKRMLGGLL